ncbi:hypothetical protein [Streptomyces sp. NPDC006739]|uniref:hypothetical protein n=1 Tax=Streptomyces sp. NPDC006739 TaxID=3364763 RepID=UPI003694CB5F
MAHDVQEEARRRLSALAEPTAAGCAPAHQMARDAALLGRLLTAAGRPGPDGARTPDVTMDDVGAALSLFEHLRHQLDRLESQVVMEARRRGMDWRQIAGHQGLNSSQAASQRHQRLTTRLEEIRQGVR